MVVIVKDKKIIAGIMVAVLAVTSLLFYSRSAEASAISLYGYFVEKSIGISGAYLDSTGMIYVNAGWKALADWHLYQLDPTIPNNLQQNPATFDTDYQYYYSVAGAIGNSIYFLGGTSSDTCPATDKIFRFTPDQLTLIGHLPAPRTEAASATYNGKIYIVGGLTSFFSSDPNFAVYNDILSFDGQSIQTVGTLPVALCSAAAEFTPDGKMLIFGGITYTNSSGTWRGQLLDSIYQFDPATGQVTQIGTLPYACGGIRAARVGNSIYIFIPEQTADQQPMNVTDIYEYANGQLTKTSVTIPEDLSYTCAISVGSKVFLFCGGLLDAKSNKIWSFDTTLIPPGAPVLTTNNQTLTWNPVPHATQYHIEESKDGTTWQEIGTTTDTHYTVSDPGSNLYRVRGDDNGAMGDYSNTVTVVVKPSAPVGLQASVNGKSVELTWGVVQGASYLVMRSLDGNSWTQIAEVSQTSCSDTNTAWQTGYYYGVIAKINGAHSDPSNTVQVTTGKIPAPTGLKATINGTKVSLVWQAAESISAYSIERSTDGVNYTTIGTSNSSSYTDNSARPDTEYYYRVRSKSGDQQSDPSQPVHILTFENPAPPPQIVSGLTAVWNGNGSGIQVTWNRGQSQIPDGALELWKMLPDGTWIAVKDIAESERDSFTWQDSNTAPGLNYSYELRVNGGLSTWFSWQTVAQSGPATGDRPMLAPGGLQVTASTGSAVLTWDPVSGAGGYTVQYSTDNGSTWQSLSVSGTSATIPRKCIARVRASSPRSQWSGIVTVD